MCKAALFLSYPQRSTTVCCCKLLTYPCSYANATETVPCTIVNASGLARATTARPAVLWWKVGTQLQLLLLLHNTLAPMLPVP